MNRFFDKPKIAAVAAALLGLAGCGGSSGPGATAVSTKVIDGAISGATVCLDRNGNGRCDSDEQPRSTTDADGKATLSVANADVGKFPLVAEVGTEAVDIDHGRVTVAYTLTTPMDQTAVISPLTTVVQQMVAASGASSADAAAAVQAQTGIQASLFADYTAAKTTEGSTDPAQAARLLVLVAQAQTSALALAEGSKAADGRDITAANIAAAVQQAMLAQLPALASALGSAAVQATDPPDVVEAALQAAATQLVANSTLSAASLPIQVAINNKLSETAAMPAAPAPFSQLVSINYTDTGNFYFRALTGSLAQNTPDAGNHTRFVDRRRQSTDGHIATWGFGGSPARNADLHWNGSAWVGCPINFESKSSLETAQGISTYDYCDGLETGSTQRASFDIEGKSLADVYAQLRAAGNTNLNLSDPGVLGSTATFPSGSALFYQTTTPLTEAVAYYPSGAYNPAGTSNAATIYSLAVSAGGNAADQPSGAQCNSAEANSPGVSATSLEQMIAAGTGTPCIFAPGSFVYNGNTYSSPELNTWWGNSTVGLGTLGSAPVNSGATAPGFFSGNTLLRAAFSGSGTNPVTYYACQQRFNNGSTRNCEAIGSGSYTIKTLGDARVLSFNNLPALAAPLTYNQVFVERGGVIYRGYQSKPNVSVSARLNTVAASAFLAQLGITPDDPGVPLALTAASYQGTWDTYDGSTAPAGAGANRGPTMMIGPRGGSLCQTVSGASFACTVTITDPASGAFTYSDGTVTASGNFDFGSGTGSGSSDVPDRTPAIAPFVAYRR